MTWKNTLTDGAVNLFLKGTKGNIYDDRQSEINDLKMSVGALTVEVNQLRKKYILIPMKNRFLLIDCTHPMLSISRQCKLHGISRSSVYYRPVEESAKNLAIVRILDEQYLNTPFYGVLRLCVLCRELGYQVNAKRIRRLMRVVGWKTVYSIPRTTRPDPISLKYPYMLTDYKFKKNNQVWSVDITYVPMKGGFMYLCAIIDMYSRLVGWGINNQMTSEWCADILESAVNTYGPLRSSIQIKEVSFSADVFTGIVKKLKMRMSMDGKGRAIDNIWIERLWRTLKYEHLYRFNYDSVVAVIKGFRTFFYSTMKKDFINHLTIKLR